MKLNRDVKSLIRLTKVKDSISFIYVDQCVIEQDDFSIIAIDAEGKTPLPVASITCLLLGPGTTITHAAVKSIAENGCLVVWCGEKIRKYYAYGAGETRSSKNIQKQMNLWYENRLEVVRRMYKIRFPEIKTDGMTLEALRGMEGARIKQAYKTASKMYGVPWHGRTYQIEDIDNSDNINRALTLAFDLLYSICEAVIISIGYSPAIGFIHTGHMRSFVYDVADFYKAQIAIPAAFEAVKTTSYDLDKAVRHCCRKRIDTYDLLGVIAKDIAMVFDIKTTVDTTVGIWDGEKVIAQSKNYDSLKSYLGNKEKNDNNHNGNSRHEYSRVDETMAD